MFFRWRALAALAVFGNCAYADITLQRLALHQYEDGPVMEATYNYLPGETAWFSARITGYTTEAVDPDQRQRRVRLSWKFQVLDPQGVLLQAPKEGSISEMLHPEDKDWMAKFITDFQVPSFAPAGVYRIPVVVKDELSGKEISGEHQFRVRGEALPPEGPLGVRNFRFLANENDRFGMQPAVYHAGDRLFARFDIIGYRVEEKNRFGVTYGLAILAGDKQVFAQPDAAEESGQPFYPQRWVPAGFGLNLDKDVAPGEYTLVISIRDQVAGTSEEIRQPFQVR